MAENPSEKPSKPASGAASPAESPTAARPLDFDDDNDANDNVSAPSAPTATATAPAIKPPKPTVRFQDDEAPPPKPPRPASPQAQAESTLIEAFPSMDAKVVKAVLVASGGKVEPAFNALLSMSDPNYRAEEAPPPRPPRPTQPRNQLEADELYARQLSEHYQSSYEGYGSRTRGEPPTSRPRRTETGLKPNAMYEDDREHSFFDDDLPVIKENVRKGFLETQSKVNKWITDFKKKLDGEDEEGDDMYGGPPSHPAGANFGSPPSDQLRGGRRSTEQRRSADRERYDTDHRELGDDFEALELRDSEAPPPKPARPMANPDLFKPTPLSPPQTGPVDEVENLQRSTQTNVNGANAATGNKPASKKWQPLTSVAPHPEPDEHDPFSLGDSEDEAAAAKTKDIKSDDSARLKKAAAEKGEAETGSPLEPTATSGSAGTRNLAAEELLKDTKKIYK